MNKMQQNLMLAWTGALFVATGGLFYYDQVVLTEKAKEDVTSVFIAKQNLSEGTVIKEDMFVKLNIRKDTLLPTYVTKLDDVIGKELTGGLVQSEALTITRISEDFVENEGEFHLRIIPDVATNLEKDDRVVVYTRKTDKTRGTVMDVLFDKKTIQSNEDNVYYVMATEEEVKDYYKAKTDSAIILVKQGANPLKDPHSTLDFSNFLPKVKEDSKKAPPPYNPFIDGQE